MAYWLLKSEPDDWSWTEQVAKGPGGAEWTDIRNFAAQKHLRAMKRGERAFFYHGRTPAEKLTDPQGARLTLCGTCPT